VEIGFSQIDKVTQKNNAGAEQSALAADELASQAKLLYEMLENFQLLETRSLSRRRKAKSLPANKGIRNPKSRSISKVSHHDEYENEEPDDITIDDMDFDRY